MSWRREQELERVGIDEPDVRTILHLDIDAGMPAFSNRYCIFIHTVEHLANDDLPGAQLKNTYI